MIENLKIWEFGNLKMKKDNVEMRKCANEFENVMVSCMKADRENLKVRKDEETYSLDLFNC